MCAEVNGKKGQLLRTVMVIAEGSYVESRSSRPSNPDFLQEWRCAGLWMEHTGARQHFWIAEGTKDKSNS